jgi:hypothetical protein
LTWVFGTATEFFGTAICVADIQVTIGEGEEREMIDCLQKVYPLEQNVVAGFAGNVQVGFSMLAALQEVVREVVGEYGEPADFDHVLERFSPFAARVWGGLGLHLRKGGCELLVAGASQAPRMLYNSHPHVVRMRAPTFEVDEIPRGTWGSIGSGADVAGYRAELERLGSEDNSGALQMEVGRPGGFAHHVYLGPLRGLRDAGRGGNQQALPLCHGHCSRLRRWYLEPGVLPGRRAGTKNCDAARRDQLARASGASKAA